jgi:hypothetical protein
MTGPFNAYKGVTWHYNSEFGDQFTIGQTYECESARIRTAGFHACLNPWHVLDFYTPYDSRFLIVEINGDIDSCDHMVTGTRMTVIKELTDREVIEQLVANRDFRLESFDAVFSEKPYDMVTGERHGLVVHSTGSNAIVRSYNDALYVLSTGNNADISVNKLCMNSLVLSYGDNALIESGGSTRIVVHGKVTVVRIIGSNHALCLSAGTILCYAGRQYMAGTDFAADTYYMTKGDRLIPMNKEEGPVKESFLFE